MSTIYLGVRLPPKPYERIRLDDIELDETIKTLKYQASLATKINTDTLDLIHCGVILNNQQTLVEQGIKNGSIVNVFKKPNRINPKKYDEISEPEIQRILFLFRSLETRHYHKAARIEIYEKIVDLHPGLLTDIGALSILRDPILLSTLQSLDTLRLCVVHHRELIEAAPIIVQQLKGKSELKLEATSLTESVGEDHLSDSSSSSDNASSSTSRDRSLRRITSNQLAQALATIGSSNSINSLANISQRNLINEQPAASNNSSNENRLVPPGGAGPITSSMVMNALSGILVRSGNSGATNSENNSDSGVGAENQSGIALVRGNSDSEISSVNRDDQNSPYFAALNQMREMGLYDVETNLQALMICSGDVGAAINLLLSGTNN